MSEPDRAARLAIVDKLAGDQVRVAQHELGRQLRLLALEATAVADALSLAGPADRVSSDLAAMYAGVRYSITMLEAARTGASVMREQVRADA